MPANLFSLFLDAWPNGAAIPDHHAFGKPGGSEPFAPSDNKSPEIRWQDAPEGTRSFSLVCHDESVPSAGDDVNQADREVPADLPRVDFYHWLLVDIPADVSVLPEGAGGAGLVPRGKPVGEASIGRTGRNDYTDWFAGDPDMEGVYGGYDGPCPPWNDSIIHRYHFTLYALDVTTLPVVGAFVGADVLAAMDGHVLASASHSGTYAMNPRLR
jgi:Raf kinase inhibitor-like YbhB/YbcL family protein